MSVRILTVCTGNICRSPYAQMTLGQALESVRPGAFEVTSAGTYAMVGEAVDPGSAHILTAMSIPHATFAARQLTEPMLENVDVVLSLEASHRSVVLSYSPRHLKRAFTVKEFARLLDAAAARQPWTQRLAGLATPEQRWAALPQHLARERGLSRVPEGHDDIEDPYRMSQETFDQMAADVDEAVARVVAFERQFS